MRLSTFSDYTIRSLVYLALQPERSTIADISSAYQISENHLMKVIHFLSQQGYIQTVRGKGGGMRLQQLPETIVLGELLRQTEGTENLLTCLSQQSDCCIQPACRMVSILKEAEQAFFSQLDQYTLADLLLTRQPLMQILKPDIAISGSVQ